MKEFSIESNSTGDSPNRIHDQAFHRRAHITGGSGSDEDLNRNTMNGPSLRRMSHVKQLPRDLKRDERLACAPREREPDARPILRDGAQHALHGDVLVIPTGM